MTGDPNNLSCQEFQAQLADLIGSGEDAASHAHLQSCANCRALLADLETIAEAARKLLPIQQPKEDLWERIEIAIKKEEGFTRPE
jgi:predicted anti-sigma-YlaC factor YlaD